MSRGFFINDHGDCLMEGLLVHPAEDPLQAAQSELARLLNTGGPEDLLVLAGAGLGWHAKAALTRDQGPAVLIFEPDPARLALMNCLGPDLDGLEIAADENSLLEALGRQMVYGCRQRVAIFSPPAYEKAAPEVGAAARRLVKSSTARCQTDQDTRRLCRSQWRENLGQNFRHTLKYPDLSLLAGVLPKVPAVVLGAGPSLDQSLPALKGVARRALVLAAASALGPLARLGEPIQVAMALEGKDESRQFVGPGLENVLLAAALSSHANHFARWVGPLGLFHLQSWVAQLIGWGRALPTGGHATSAAFSLAVLWGCDPIILVAQDLAYTKGRIHASGRPGGEDEKRPETVTVPAIGGGAVETSAVMRSYLAWYQEAAAHLSSLGQGPVLINATAQGALIPGFAHQPLSEVLAGLPEARVDFASVLEALPRLPRPQAPYLAQRLAKARQEVKTALAELPEKGLKAVSQGEESSSVVAAALADLPFAAGADQAGESLKQMLDTLKAMGEGLYA